MHAIMKQSSNYKFGVLATAKKYQQAYHLHLAFELGLKHMFEQCTTVP